MDLTVLLITAVAIVALTLAMALMPPMGLVALAICSWSLNMMPIDPVLGRLGVTTAVVLLCVAILKSTENHSVDRSVAPVAFWPLLAGALGIITLPWSFSSGISAVASLQVLLLGLMTLLAARFLTGRLVVRAAFVALSPIVLASAFWDASSTEPVIDATRHSGLTDNPNSLGLLVGVWACLAVGVGKRAVMWAVPLAAFEMLLSGSRGSSLALGTALATAAWVWLGDLAPHRRGVRLLGRAAFGALLLVAVLLLGALWRRRSEMGSESGIARTDVSGRIEALSGNWHLVQLRPISGYGLGFTPLEGFGAGVAAHFFPLSMLVELGVLGLLLTLAAVVLLLTTRWRGSPFLGASVAFALTSMVSESWLTGAGSVWTLAFWMSTASWATDLRTGMRDVSDATQDQVPSSGLQRESQIVLLRH